MITTQITRNSYFDQLPAFIQPKRLLPLVVTTAFAWHHFEPASLLGRVALLAASCVGTKAILAIADCAYILYGTCSTSRHRSTSDILSIHPPAAIKQSLDAALMKMKEEEWYQPFKIALKANTDKQVEAYIMRALSEGLCSGEIDEIAQIVESHPTLSSAQIIKQVQLEQIMHAQITEIANRHLGKSLRITLDVLKPIHALKLHEQHPSHLCIVFSEKNEIKLLKAHVIFVQCSHAKFRFYDGNANLPSHYKGFYDFPSKEALEKGLKTFIDSFYENILGYMFR